ncbi:MAG: stage V sporulation protein AD, partial [Clostridia bacterium]
FYPDDSDVKSGASGCGCCSTVFSGYWLDMLKRKKINKVLLIATGALMSPISTMQGETIPCIAHAISIENNIGEDIWKY